MHELYNLLYLEDMEVAPTYQLIQLCKEKDKYDPAQNSQNATDYLNS